VIRMVIFQNSGFTGVFCYMDVANLADLGKLGCNFGCNFLAAAAGTRLPESRGLGIWH